MQSFDVFMAIKGLFIKKFHNTTLYIPVILCIECCPHIRSAYGCYVRVVSWLDGLIPNVMVFILGFRKIPIV